MKEIKAFWNSRRGSAIIVPIALVLAYIVASRAIDTGSLQQYFLTFTLFLVAVNRAIYTIRNK